MPVISGFLASMSIGGVAFNFAEVSIDESAEDLDTTSSEGRTGDPSAVADSLYPGGFQSAVAGPRIARVSVKQATYDTDHNPYLAPFTFLRGDYIAMEVFPDRQDEDTSWQFPSLLVTEMKYEQTAKGLQPVSFSGRSNGKYFPPGTSP